MLARIAEMRAQMRGRKVSHRYRVDFDLTWRGGPWIPCRFPDRHIEAMSEDMTWPNMAKVMRAYQAVADCAILALIGDRGTGKTQLACEIAHATNRRYCYFRCDTLLSTIKSWFTLSAGDRDHNERMLRTVPLLVIDEVQERQGTVFDDQILTSLVDKRYGLMLPTILIANLSLGAFDKNVGASIASRLSEGGVIMVADWPSFRGAALAAGGRA